MNDEIDSKMSSTVEWSVFSVLFAFLIFFGLLLITWLLWDLLAPVFMALLLCFLFRPLIRLMSKWNWPSWLTISSILVILVTILVITMVFLLPLLVDQITQLKESLPEYINSLLNFIAGDDAKLKDEIRSEITNYSNFSESLVTIILKGTAKSFKLLIKGVNNFIYAVLYLILLLVFFITFCLYITNLKDWLIQFLPHSQREKFLEISHKIYEASWVFLRTRLLIALILSAFFSIGWGIAGVPYWLILGIATGLLNIIPYASTLGWLIALLANALEADNNVSFIFALVWPTVVFVIGQALDGWVLTSWLQGRKLDINPVIILFSVLAGGLTAGFVGMLLAIPFIAAFQIVFTDVIKPKLIKWAETH